MEKIYNLSYELKDLLVNNSRIVLLNNLEEEMNNNDEVMALAYKKDDKATSTEITQRTVELKDFLRRYFTQKSAEELRPQNEENLKIEIRNAINDSILSSSKIKDVRFLKLRVIQQ